MRPSPRPTGRTPSRAASATTPRPRSAGSGGSRAPGTAARAGLHLEGERVVERVDGQRQRVAAPGPGPSSRRARAGPSAASPSPCSRRSPTPGSRRGDAPTATSRVERARGRTRGTACITSDRARGRPVRPHRRGEDGGRDRARRAAARARRGPARRLGRRAAGLPRPRDADRRGDRAPSRRGSSTACSPSSTRARPSRPGEFAARAHAEIDAALAAGRRPIVVGGTGLYLQAALTDLELRPPPDPAVRERIAARARGARPRGAPRRAGRAGARGRRARSTRATAPGSARALELLEMGEEPAPGGADSRLWTARAAPPDAAVRPRDGARRPSTSASTRASTRWSPPAPRRRSSGPTAAGAVAHRARRARLRGAARAATSRRMKRRTRNYAKRQLTWMRRLPGRARDRPHRAQRPSGRRRDRPYTGRAARLGR